MTGFSSRHAQELRYVRDAGFVGAGKGGYYLVAEADGRRETHSLWLFEHGGAAPRRLAAELDDLMGPSPSPDGTQIAVLAEVEGVKQVCLVPVDGGSVERLTALPQGVSGRPRWSPDGRSIAFTAGPSVVRDRSLPYRVDRVTYRFDGLGYLDDVVQDVYVVDVADRVVRQLTDDRCMNSDPCWSPDGRTLAYLVSFHPDRAHV